MKTRKKLENVSTRKKICTRRHKKKMSEKNAPSPIGRPLCKKKINLIAATFENDKNPKPDTIAHLASILKLSEKRIKIEFARLRAKNKKDQYLEVIKNLNTSAPEQTQKKTSMPSPPRGSTSMMEKPSCSTTGIPEAEEPKEFFVSKSRSIYTIDDMKALTKSFDKTQHPSKKRIEKLAKKLDKTPAQVSGWFIRQRTKVPKQRFQRGLTIKREREESPDNTQDSSVLDKLLTSSDEEKEQAAKKICRRSLPSNLIKTEPGLEEITSQGENIELTVKNISENDEGFYLDPEASKKLFHEIWKTERKLPKEAMEFLAKRSGKTFFAVRSWFYDQTKKDEKKTCRRSLPTHLVLKNLQEEQKSSEDIKIKGVKNISENDAGFYLDHEESKKLFREIWKTERMPPKEAIEYLSKRSSKTSAAVRLWFQRETKKECDAKKICILPARSSLPAVLTVEEPKLDEKISKNENIVTSVKNISQNDAGFYLDQEESKKLFFEIWKTERKPPQKVLEFLAKRSRKTPGAVRTWFWSLTKKDEDRLHKEKSLKKGSIQNESQSNASPQLSKTVAEARIQEVSNADENLSAETSPNKDIMQKNETEKTPIKRAIKIKIAGENDLPDKLKPKEQFITVPESLKASKNQSEKENRSIAEEPKTNHLKFVNPVTDKISVVLPKIPDSILKSYLQEREPEDQEEKEQIPPLEKIPSDELENEIISSSIKTLPFCHKYGSPVIDKNGRILIHVNTRELVNIYQCSHLHALLL